MNKFEGEFPQEISARVSRVFRYFRGTFWQIVDDWRPEHLWEKGRILEIKTSREIGSNELSKDTSYFTQISYA